MSPTGHRFTPLNQQRLSFHSVEKPPTQSRFWTLLGPRFLRRELRSRTADAVFASANSASLSRGYKCASCLQQGLLTGPVLRNWRLSRGDSVYPARNSCMGIPWYAAQNNGGCTHH